MQNWVTVVMDAEGRFSVGFDAIQLGNVTDPDDRARHVHRLRITEVETSPLRAWRGPRRRFAGRKQRGISG